MKRKKRLNANLGAINLPSNKKQVRRVKTKDDTIRYYTGLDRIVCVYFLTNNYSSKLGL